ncbi:MULTISPECIES: hemin uptake protein HemP [Thioalkalivibrio]|uniref:hemin uptake protein HemP n=1 Tax=Thioalkalivibrio TaxID=106633 RepID=UPI0003651CA4|nr:MULTISPECIES: hemin uptake protein HemP [Thioalkalivibrio]
MNARDGTIGPLSSRPATGPREVASEDLLGPARQIRIRHRGEWYTLRQTANDKLILTK